MVGASSEVQQAIRALLIKCGPFCEVGGVVVVVVVVVVVLMVTSF